MTGCLSTCIHSFAHSGSALQASLRNCAFLHYYLLAYLLIMVVMYTCASMYDCVLILTTLYEHGHSQKIFQREQELLTIDAPNVPTIERGAKLCMGRQ